MKVIITILWMATILFRDPNPDEVEYLIDRQQLRRLGFMCGYETQMCCDSNGLGYNCYYCASQCLLSTDLLGNTPCFSASCSGVSMDCRLVPIAGFGNVDDQVKIQTGKLQIGRPWQTHFTMVAGCKLKTCWLVTNIESQTYPAAAANISTAYSLDLVTGHFIFDTDMVDPSTAHGAYIENTMYCQTTNIENTSPSPAYLTIFLYYCSVPIFSNAAASALFNIQKKQGDDSGSYTVTHTIDMQTMWTWTAVVGVGECSNSLKNCVAGLSSGTGTPESYYNVATQSGKDITVTLDTTLMRPSLLFTMWCTQHSYGNSLPYQPIGWLVEVQTNPLANICSGSNMTPTLSATTHIQDYTSGGWFTLGSMGNDYTSNTDNANCKMTACVIKIVGCTTLYSGVELKVGSNFPFKIKMKKNVQAGFHELVCVECTNHQTDSVTGTVYNFQTIQTSFDITQNHQCNGATNVPATEFGLSNPTFQLTVQFVVGSGSGSETVIHTDIDKFISICSICTAYQLDLLNSDGTPNSDSQVAMIGLVGAETITLDTSNVLSITGKKVKATMTDPTCSFLSAEYSASFTVTAAPVPVIVTPVIVTPVIVVQNAPEFSPAPADILVTADMDSVLYGGGVTTFSFMSPLPTDTENDSITLTMVQPTIPCGCATWQIHVNGSYSLSLDLLQATQADHGSHAVSITLNDGQSTLSNVYTFQLIIDFQDANNHAPKLASTLTDVLLTVDEDGVTNGTQVSTFSYLSAVPSDRESNLILTSVTIPSVPCGCLIKTVNSDNSFTLTMDLTQVTSSDAGTHLIQVSFKDDQYVVSQNLTLETFNLKITFISATGSAGFVPLFPTAIAVPVVVATVPVVVATVPVVAATVTATAVSQEVVAQETDEQESEPDVEAEPEQEKPKVSAPAGSPTIGAKFNPWAKQISEEEAKKLFMELDEKVEIKPRVKEVEPEPVLLQIKQISRNGVMNIWFNQDLIVPPFIDRKKKLPDANQTKSSLSNLNKTDDRPQKNKKKRKLIPLSELNVARDIMDFIFILKSDVEESDIEYYLEILEWEPQNIKVFINFTNPLLISKGLNADTVVVKIKNKMLFRSADSNERLKSDKVYIQKDLPRQLPFGVSEELLQAQAETASSGMKATFFVQILLQVCLKGSLDQLWVLFFTLQIICYLKIYDVPIPSNAEIYVDEFTKLIEFDILNPDGLLQAIGYENFRLMDFILGRDMDKFANTDGSKSIYEELRFFILIGVAALTFVILLALLSLFRRFKDKIIAFVQKQKKKFIFNGIIRSISIVYIKFCISFGAQIEMFLRGNKSQMQIDRIMGTGMFFALLGYPFFSWLTISTLRPRLEEKQVSDKISNFYTEIKMKGKFNRNLSYYPIFLFRKIMFVAVPTFLYMFSYFQIQLLLLLQTFYLIYYAGSMPHIEKSRCYIEIFNEIMIMIINYHMVSFSEFNLDVDMQFNMGYSLIGFIFLVVFVNIMNMVIKQIQKHQRSKVIKQNRKNIAAQMSLIVESAEKSRERKEKVKSKCAKSDTERKLLPGQEDLADEQQKWLDKQPYPQAIAKLFAMTSNKNDPKNYFGKIKKIPAHYKEKVYWKPQMATIKEEEEAEEILAEINQTFGNFGNFAEYNRRAAVLGHDETLALPPLAHKVFNLKPAHVVEAERKRAEFTEAYVERELTQDQAEWLAQQPYMKTIDEMFTKTKGEFEQIKQTPEHYKGKIFFSPENQKDNGELDDFMDEINQAFGNFGNFAEFNRRCAVYGNPEGMALPQLAHVAVPEQLHAMLPEDMRRKDLEEEIEKIKKEQLNPPKLHNKNARVKPQETQETSVNMQYLLNRSVETSDEDETNPLPRRKIKKSPKVGKKKNKSKSSEKSSIQQVLRNKSAEDDSDSSGGSSVTKNRFGDTATGFQASEKSKQSEIYAQNAERLEKMAEIRRQRTNKMERNLAKEVAKPDLNEEQDQEEQLANMRQRIAARRKSRAGKQ